MGGVFDNDMDERWDLECFLTVKVYDKQQNRWVTDHERSKYADATSYIPHRMYTQSNLDMDEVMHQRVWEQGLQMVAEVSGIKSVEQVREEYRSLVAKYHALVRAWPHDVPFPHHLLNIKDE